MSNRLILEEPKVVIVLLVILFADDTLQNVTRRNATTYDVSYQNVGSNLCEEYADCSDHSDEDCFHCDNSPCEDHQFKCAFGDCIDLLLICDGTMNCLNGLDEDEDLCKYVKGYPHQYQHPIIRFKRSRKVSKHRSFKTTTSTEATAHRYRTPFSFKTTTSTEATAHRYRKPLSFKRTSFPEATADSYRIPYKIAVKCLTPADVEDGKITHMEMKRGDALYNLIELTCDSNSFDLIGSSHSTCSFGGWSPALGVCKRKCDALQRVGVSVTCQHLNVNISCTKKIPSGSTAEATCQMGYRDIDPVYLKCIDGNWDYDLPECTVDCGMTSGFGKTLIIGGEKAAVNGFPWHVGIYELSKDGYEQKCSGSILTEKIIISVAHCFWLSSPPNSGLKDSNLYSVAAGKTNRSYDNEEYTAQKTTIEKILIPEQYSGNTNMQMGDIALLILTDPLKFTREVLPVCLNMQRNFVNYQLQDGRYGTVAGWGLTSVGGNPSEELRYANLTVISNDNCKKLHSFFKRYVTYDKFCAGYVNKNITMCTGDSGGGLVFSSTEAHIIRYYIQGVVSVGVPDQFGSTCAADYYTTFTKIEKHHYWIKEKLAE